MTNPLLHSQRWRSFKPLVFATYGDVCHICGHGGARQVDHLESVTEHPELIFALSNVRPAHGAPGNRCLVCQQNCNQLRGGYSVERARKLIQERSAQLPKPEPPKDNGREW